MKLKILIHNIFLEQLTGYLLHRVFWRVLGQRVAQKNDTAGTSMEVTGLRPGLTYEVAVKAGNHMGTSVLTPTIPYSHVSPYISTASTHSEYSKHSC